MAQIEEWVVAAKRLFRGLVGVAIQPIHFTSPFFPLAGHIHAITLWPFCFYRRGYESDPALRAHEEYHWRQGLR